MTNNYKGKYPERIRAVYSLKDRKGVVGVTLNNGDRYTIAARDNDPATMPEPGREISDFNAVKVGPVFKFGYWSTHDADGSRLYHEEKPDWWDRGFRKDEPNADGIGWCAKYPLSEPGTDPESADNFGPVAGTQDEALRAMEAAWLEWRADYVKDAEGDAAKELRAAIAEDVATRAKASPVEALQAAQDAIEDVLDLLGEDGEPREELSADTIAEAYDTLRGQLVPMENAIMGREAKTGFKRAEPASNDRARLENVAAISGTIWEEDRTGLFYEAFGKAGNGGFIEIWQLAVEMGEAVSAFEKANPGVWDEVTWCDVIGAFVADTMKTTIDSGELPHDHAARVLKAVQKVEPDWKPAPTLGAGTFKSAMQKNAPEVAQLVRADLIEAGQWLVGSSPDRNQFVQEVDGLGDGRVVLRTNYTGRTDKEPGGSSIMNGTERLYVADSREAVRPKGPAQTTGAKL